jgi:hypothetical protein
MSEETKSFLEKLSAQLLDWDSQVNELKQKAVQAKGDAKLKYEKEIANLNEKMEQVKTRVEEFHHAGGEAWESAKDGLDKASKELAVSFNSIKEIFKKM